MSAPTDPALAPGDDLRVLVVDDQPLARIGLARIIDPEPGMRVVGECSDGDEVVEGVRRHCPDVVLMDVRMKRVDGAEATRRLGAAMAAPPPVLVLTTFDDDETVAAALGAGAVGFVLKDAQGDDIVRAVRAVGSGAAWLDPVVTGRVIDGFRARRPPRATGDGSLARLTEREREVLALMVRGRSNREIAADLLIGEGTVKTHVGRVLTKLGLRDRAAAIVFGYDHGLANPGR